MQFLVFFSLLPMSCGQIIAEHPQGPLDRTPPIAWGFVASNGRDGIDGLQEGETEWTVQATLPGKAVILYGQSHHDYRVPVTYSWEFGAGFSPRTAQGSPVTVSATTPGTYQCSMTASTQYGSDTLEFTAIVLP